MVCVILASWEYGNHYEVSLVEIRHWEKGKAVMERYGWIVLLISIAGFFICLFAGSIYAYNHKTFRYIWLPICGAGFCVFTAFVHLVVLISYDDIGGPNYEAYKDWDIYDFIWSDVKCLVFWTGIGMLNYLAFIRQKRILKYLIFAGVFVSFILFLMIPLLFSVTPVEMDSRVNNTRYPRPLHASEAGSTTPSLCRRAEGADSG